MTATPIPRTLTMTVYSDLEVSTIDELPRDRGKIITAARDESQLDDVLTFLRRELGAGRQAYIVDALTDESEQRDARAATSEFDRLLIDLRDLDSTFFHVAISGPTQ